MHDKNSRFTLKISLNIHQLKPHEIAFKQTNIAPVP